jgi:hypothetical protein
MEARQAQAPQSTASRRGLFSRAKKQDQRGNDAVVETTQDRLKEHMAHDPLTEKLRTLLTRKGKTDDGWQTRDELARELGIGLSKVGKLLRELFDDNSLESARRLRPAIDGSNRPVPVYRVKPAAVRGPSGANGRVRRVRAGARPSRRKT